MKYEVTIQKADDSTAKEIVDCGYVKDQDGFLYFYNKEDNSDLDNPVAMYNKGLIIKIKKRKEGKRNGNK